MNTPPDGAMGRRDEIGAVQGDCLRECLVGCVQPELLPVETSRSRCRHTSRHAEDKYSAETRASHFISRLPALGVARAGATTLSPGRRMVKVVSLAPHF